jgi:hypothetical protein
VLIPLGVIAAVGLLAFSAPAMRVLAASVACGALLLAPAAWAIDTLGYSTSATFPSGGPASVEMGLGGASRGRFPGLFGAPGGPRGLTGGAPGGPALFGGTGGGVPPAGVIGRGPGSPPFPMAGAGPQLRGVGRMGAGGPFGDGRAIASVLGYVKKHGGGTIAVSSQSSAAVAIIAQNANVAGIGGFSGRESQVSASWLAQEVRSGKIRWILAETGVGRRAIPGDRRLGSRPVMSAVTRACRAASSVSGAASRTGPGAPSSTLYDCQGRAVALSAQTAERWSA